VRVGTKIGTSDGCHGSNMIQTVIVQPSPQLTQTQNVGDGESYGVKLSADTQLNDKLRVESSRTPAGPAASARSTTGYRR
jgi:hypothetical protein